MGSNHKRASPPKAAQAAGGLKGTSRRQEIRLAQRIVAGELLALAAVVRSPVAEHLQLYGSGAAAAGRLNQLRLSLQRALEHGELARARRPGSPAEPDPAGPQAAGLQAAHDHTLIPALRQELQRLWPVLLQLEDLQREVVGHQDSRDPRGARQAAELCRAVGLEPPGLRRLCQAFRSGLGRASAAKAELVVLNLPLVSYFAERSRNQGLDFVDLVQEGSVGLMRAVDKFDPGRGVRFSTYAGWWIKQAIGRAIVNQGSLIRLPGYQRQRLRRLYAVTERAMLQHGRRPELSAVASQFGLSADRIRSILSLARAAVSLDSAADDQLPLGESLANPQAADPEAELSDQQLRDDLRRALKRLTAREQRILQLRYGIDHRRELSLREIAETFELSRERIRQIEQRALSKLKRYPWGRRLKAFLEQ